MCEECEVSLASHHWHERTLIAKYAKMRLAIQMFRCGEMCGGMDVIGKGQARKQHSKNTGRGAVARGAGNELLARGRDSGSAKSALCK